MSFFRLWLWHFNFLLLGFSADEVESLKKQDADFKTSTVYTYACQKIEMYAKDFPFVRPSASSDDKITVLGVAHNTDHRER